MIPDRVDGIIEAVGRILRGLVFDLLVQPGAHRIAAGEEVGMPLAVDGRTASTHRKAHDGPVRLVPDAPVFRFDIGQQFLEEKVLIVPSRGVEIAVRDLVDVLSAGVRHDDDHIGGFPRGDQFVGDLFHPALFLPVLIASVEAVEQIDDGIGLLRIVETVG